MVDTIINNDDVRLIHLSVVTDSVLLHGLGVQDSNLHQPHTRYGEQHHLITPEVPSQHKMQVLVVRQWRRPPSSLLDLWILLNLDAVMAGQRPVLALQDKLAVMGHEVDHHPPEVTIGEVGGLPRSGRTN